MNEWLCRWCHQEGSDLLELGWIFQEKGLVIRASIQCTKHEEHLCALTC